MAKRITFLLGNGAAIPWGAPTTEDVTRYLCQNRNFPKTRDGENICQYLKDKIVENGYDADKITFETIISVLEELYQYFNLKKPGEKDFFHPNLPFLFEEKGWLENLKSFQPDPDSNKFHYGENQTEIVSPEIFENKESKEAYHFQNLLNWSLNTISGFLSNYCKTVCDKEPYNKALKDFIKYFKDSDYILRFYTTNYDRLLPDVLGEDHVFDGFDKQDISANELIEKHKYDLKGIYNKKDVLNYFNLHGCLFWEFDSFINEPFADYYHHFYRTSDVHTDISGFTEQNFDRSKPIQSSNIITGFNKLQRLAKNPINAFYSAFQEDCINSDLLVTVGYGFGDPHLNNFIKNGVGYDDTNFLHVTKIDPKSYAIDESYFDSSEGYRLNELEPVQNYFEKFQDSSSGWMISERGTHRIFTDGFDKFLLDGRYQELRL